MTGAELREARKAVGLSIRKAAELSKTPYRTWQNWEAEGKEHRRPPGIVFAWLELWTRESGREDTQDTIKEALGL